MEPIQMFRANDGTVHKTEQLAINRDELLVRINEIENLLPPEPKDDHCSFANGGGYFLIDSENYKKAVSLLFKLAKEITGRDFDNIHGIIGRYLDDMSSPVYATYYRLICIDSKMRMWGQSYFAYNPDKGTQKQLN